MYLTNTSMDTVALIGIILLAGIVVKNGIVIIDHLNQLRKGGMDRFEATLQAGRDRYRPVMMTALATMLGCVPLALGGGVGSEVSFTSLGRALIGGMTTGTILTLVVVPLFYTMIDDLGQWFLHYFGTIVAMLGRGEAPVKPETAA
jgi:HAE1 family hydrophobic/amphiphilic exporter-1